MIKIPILKPRDLIPQVGVGYVKKVLFAFFILFLTLPLWIVQNGKYFQDRLILLGRPETIPFTKERDVNKETQIFISWELDDRYIFPECSYVLEGMLSRIN